MSKYVVILFCLFIVPSTFVFGDTIYSKNDILIFDKYIDTITKLPSENKQDLIVNTAKFFLNTPYVATTLEQGEKENLIVNLSELDCTTFVETCLALYTTVRSQDKSFAKYSKELAKLRYRNGMIDGYCSRLHYSSDWIYENEKRGFWKNISIDLKGERIDKPVNYMSTHPQAYKHLKDNKGNVSKMANIERDINERGNFIVVPKRKISDIQKYIEDGDVIIFATAIGGLDYSHMGIAYWIKGELHFIHASSLAKQVIIESKTLINYCYGSKNCIGISILRVN